MNVGSRYRGKQRYICDKCKQEIPFTHHKGFIGINHYYRSFQTETAKKDFDLCANCEKKLKEWLNTREILTTKELISAFPIFEERDKKED